MEISDLAHNVTKTKSRLLLKPRLGVGHESKYPHGDLLVIKNASLKGENDEKKAARKWWEICRKTRRE